ncbi:glucan 1,4-beta-glucosidase [Alteromonas sp. KUL42]|uniref:glycoside hydrolase family 3 protein n=1 Tax=Alteromonas sp. KUL42 TaxID=2480797 RepID=UPI001035759D|nr:exo 1,3/1,4-beta-D-glucan glucohydrolase [Alteromonas sp. KUL42]TAP33795.1 glycoside hydrolase family 3 protein [Alteromonas sp. KUL42]GEA08311.1 glucan 1,4-beta-glucosidase [Alteromonas sp. KUL42]
MRKKYIAKVVAGALVGVMSSTMITGCNSPNSSLEQRASSSDVANENDMNKAAKIWPKLDIEVKADPAVEAKVSDIMSTMTLKQKIAQMIQPEIRNITVDDMRKYGFGSYLNGGGAFPNNNKHATPEDWVALAEALYQASIDDTLDGSTIPTMWGTDAVHGHNNVIGATLFPHNIGLGAANNPELMESIAHITAKEVMATGIDWVFAPTVAVVRDDRWGRTYESYSEDPAIVREYAASVVKGLQGAANKDFLSDQRVISTVKHFVGDGGTVGGDDQGDNIASEQELFDIHAQGYVGGLTAGAQSVMASFNSWHGEKLHGHKYLLTDVLKEQMGFDGFVVGDWNGHGQVAGCNNEDCAQAINAGLDIFMVPNDWKALFDNTLAQVENGTIPMARIDDAVRRILRVKVRAGLFEKPSPANRPLSGDRTLIGKESHREVARQAVKESLVLLKNKGKTLPLDAKARILVAGDAADNIGKQSGGWSITWQGTNNTNDDFPGGTSIFDGINEHVTEAGGKVVLSVDGEFQEKPDVAIVVFGEEPYAEGHGDRETLIYQQGNKRDLALLEKLKQKGIPVVSVFISGRPMWVNAELNASDAFVAAWLPGSEGAAVADVLFGKQDFKGKLPFSWPATPQQIVNIGDDDYAPLLPYGFGLTFDAKNTLDDSLDTSIPTNDDAQQVVSILSGAVQAPWELWLYSGNTSMAVNASTHTVGAITYRTVDKEVQEDARKVTFDGSEYAAMRFASKSYFREDLSAQLLNDTVLTFNVSRHSAMTSPVLLSMNCEGEGDEAGSCSARIDISEQLNALPQDTWSNVSIDLQCFVDAGIDFSGVVVPFEMGSAGKVSLSVADIQFAPKADRGVELPCN